MKAIDTYKYSPLQNSIRYYGDFLKFPLTSLTTQIDFLFIDAEKISYLAYYLACKPFLSDDAIIVFDDVIKYQTKISDLLAYLNHHDLSYSIVPLTQDDGILMMGR
jgi:predicted O-methyltransferase YrrM